MANEPDRPIERLLHAAAKKRRDEAGAPLELHPATRRLLQGEVARKHAAAGRESRSPFQGLGQLWPRFAGGLAILALLAVAGYMLLPIPGKGKPQALLARNEPTPQTRPAKEALPPSPVAPAEIPPRAALAARANPPAAAFADKLQPARPGLAPQIAGGLQPLPKDSLAAQSGVEMKERLALAASPQAANRNKVAEMEIATSSATPAPAPAVVASGALDRPSRSFGQAASPANAPATPAAPSSVAAPPAEARVVTADESAKLAVDRAGQSGFAYKSLPAGASADTLKPSAAPTAGLLVSAAAVRKEAQGVRAAQRFAQVAQSPKTKASLGDKAAPAHPVLASFQLEQTGRELRVVDGDGSVYSGYLQIAAPARPQLSVKAAAPAVARASRAPVGVLEEKAPATVDSDQLTAQTYFFRVTGTNRTLQKKVVFTGNLMAATNSAWFQPVTNHLNLGSSFGGVLNGSAQPGLLPLGNSHISGKVVIGSGKAVEINALPESP